MPLNSRRSLKSSLKFNLKSSVKFNLKSSLVHLVSLEPDSETRWIGWDCRHFLPKWVAVHYAFTCCFDIPGSECNWGGLISQRAPWSTIFAHDERTLCQKTQRLISNDEHDIYRKVWRVDREGREQFLRKLTKPSDLRRVLFLFLTVVCLFHWFFLFSHLCHFYLLLSWKSENWTGTGWPIPRGRREGGGVGRDG